MEYHTRALSHRPKAKDVLYRACNHRFQRAPPHLGLVQLNARRDLAVRQCLQPRRLRGVLVAQEGEAGLELVALGGVARAHLLVRLRRAGQPVARGSHSSTLQLNVSTLCPMW